MPFVVSRAILTRILKQGGKYASNLRAKSASICNRLQKVSILKQLGIALELRSKPGAKSFNLHRADAGDREASKS